MSYSNNGRRYNLNAQRRGRKLRDEDRRVKSKPIDYTGKKRVYIPQLRLYVWASVEESDDDVIARHLAHHRSAGQGKRG